MNVVSKQSLVAEIKDKERTLIQNMILKRLVKDRSLAQTPLLWSQPQQFEQKNQQKKVDKVATKQ
jgi:hypothetical protein